MIKIKTFTQSLEIFKTAREINDLDEMVNNFIANNSVQKVVSVSDSVTTDDSGATMGIIRVLTYEV